jgi:hypothetical protein
MRAHVLCMRAAPSRPRRPCRRCARRNALDRPTAEALAGLSRLRELGVYTLTQGYDLDGDRVRTAAAAVAALPPSLRVLWVADVGCCCEGAALVVPPARAQQLELRCYDHPGSRLGQTGRLYSGWATVEDVRAFLRWLGPAQQRHVRTLVLGAWAGVGVCLIYYKLNIIIKYSPA